MSKFKGYDELTTVAGGDVFITLDISDTAMSLAGSTKYITFSNLASAVGDVVNHDDLQNFASDEHVAHSSITVAGGDGMTGSGTIDGNVTITLATPSTLDGSTTNAVTASSHTHALDETAIDHDNLQNFASDEHVAHSTVTITAGTGLSGGGDISANLTIALSHLGLESLADPDEIGRAH